MIRKNSRVLVVALLILLSTIIPAFAAAAPTYTISGTVKDGSGKTLSGVKVTVGSKHYTTLMNGSYKIAGLAKTNQAISISLNGYVAASRNIKLGSDATHNFTLVKRDTIIAKAKTFRGTPHRILDCSHFVNKVYQQVGLAYAYTDCSKIASIGDFEKVSTPLPGDIILFGPSPDKAEHMGIVIDPAKKQFIGAQSRGVAIAVYDGTQAWGNPKYNDRVNRAGYYKIAGFYRYKAQ